MERQVAAYDQRALVNVALNVVPAGAAAALYLSDLSGSSDRPTEQITVTVTAALQCLMHNFTRPYTSLREREAHYLTPYLESIQPHAWVAPTMFLATIVGLDNSLARIGIGIFMGHTLQLTIMVGQSFLQRVAQHQPSVGTVPLAATNLLGSLYIVGQPTLSVWSRLLASNYRWTIRGLAISVSLFAALGRNIIALNEEVGEEQGVITQQLIERRLNPPMSVGYPTRVFTHIAPCLILSLIMQFGGLGGTLWEVPVGCLLLIKFFDLMATALTFTGAHTAEGPNQSIARGLEADLKVLPPPTERHAE